MYQAWRMNKNTKTKVCITPSASRTAEFSALVAAATKKKPFHLADGNKNLHFAISDLHRLTKTSRRIWINIMKWIEFILFYSVGCCKNTRLLCLLAISKKTDETNWLMKTYLLIMIQYSKRSARVECIWNTQADYQLEEVSQNMDIKYHRTIGWRIYWLTVFSTISSFGNGTCVLWWPECNWFRL